MTEGVDLDRLVFGQVKEPIHAPEGLGMQLVPWVPGYSKDDIRAFETTHGEQGMATENRVALPPPATERGLRHVGDLGTHAAEDRTCGPANPRGPGHVAHDLFQWAHG